jgi:putative nucleotidyltransferase with HDIG domain
MSEAKLEQTGDINSILHHIQKLPSPPTLVMELLDNLNDENISFATLTNKIALDQAIVARVMRVANSSFFGLSGRVGSISDAARVLGTNNLRGLVMAAGIIDAFPRQDTGFDWISFWRHGIATAVCAKLLASGARLNPETAFTAGLLHDIGKLVIVVYFPNAFSQLHEFEAASSPESLQAEKVALGFDHAALGGELAKRWRFPLAIQQAVELHHTQIQADEVKTLTDVVYIANLISRAVVDGYTEGDGVVCVAAVAKMRLGLENDKLQALITEAQRLYEGAVMLLGS